MPDSHANFGYSTVATAPSPATSGTSLVVAAGQGALFPAVPFNATIWPTGAQPLSTTAEIVRVTARSTDTLTITRAQESTSARTVVVGDQVAATVTAKTLTDVETESVAKVLYDANTVLAADTDNTPAAVTMAASTILARLAAGNIKAASVAEIVALLGPSLAGYKMGQAQVTSDRTTTQTTRSSATTWLTAPSITFDGATEIIITVFFPVITNSASPPRAVSVTIWEDSTDLAEIIVTSVSPNLNNSYPLITQLGQFIFTPTAGAKVYTARAWVDAASTGTGGAGTGASAGRVPAFIRIERSAA